MLVDSSVELGNAEVSMVVSAMNNENGIKVIFRLSLKISFLILSCTPLR